MSPTIQFLEILLFVGYGFTLAILVVFIVYTLKQNHKIGKDIRFLKMKETISKEKLLPKNIDI